MTCPARTARRGGRVGGSRMRGFTLMEMMAALAIAGLVLAMAVPASARFYQSMQYRAAVRSVVSVLTAARYEALTSGRRQDVSIDPANRQLRLNQRVEQLPSDMTLTVQAARELSREGRGVIRFYPAGGASGGGVDIRQPGGSGVRVSVDWLQGGISQEAYASD